MNIDDLVKVYARALEQQRNRKRGNSSGTANEGTASGIAAVVKALRDEIVGAEYISVGHWFNEILGPAESEKAAGGPTSDAGAPICGDTAPAADLSVGERLVRSAREAALIARYQRPAAYHHGPKDEEHFGPAVGKEFGSGPTSARSVMIRHWHLRNGHSPDPGYKMCLGCEHEIDDLIKAVHHAGFEFVHSTMDADEAQS